MSGHIEKMATSMTHIPNGIRQRYDARFKLVVINYVEKTSNCNAARKFTVVEGNT
jgi:hypothetical protein